MQGLAIMEKTGKNQLKSGACNIWMDKWLYFRVMTVVEFQAKQLKVAYASKLDDHKRTRNLF